MTSFVVRLDETDLVAAYRLVGRRERARPLLLVAALLATILVSLLILFPEARHAFVSSALLAGLSGAVLLAATLLGLVLAALPWLVRRAARRTLAEHPGMRGEIGYTVSADTLGIRTAYSDAAYPWDRFFGWRENQRIVLILLTRQLFYVIPKPQVADADLARLREGLRSKASGALIGAENAAKDAS